MRRGGSRQGTPSSSKSDDVAMEVNENVDTTRASSRPRSRQGSAGPSKTLVKRGSKRTLPQLKEVDENEEEEVPATQSKDDKFSVDELIDKVCTDQKGQKTMIKRLLSQKAALFSETTELRRNQLRRILWTPSVLASPEGQKLAALILLEIKPEKGMLLIKKRVMQEDMKSTDCRNYGSMLLIAYTMALKRDKESVDEYGEGGGTLATEVRDCFTAAADAAIRTSDTISERFFLLIFSSLERADRGKFDSMIYRAFEPILWTRLQSLNDRIRFHASGLLLRFFPISEKDPGDDTIVTIEEQFDYMFDMLMDPCVPIRQEAAKRVLQVMANYYVFMSFRICNKFMTRLVDELTKDSVPSIRVAVIEGFQYLFPISAALNFTEKSLKVFVPRTLNDRNEKVRLASVRLLQALKFHRLIKFHEVVPMTQLMTRLELETSEVIRREIVKLVFKTFIPGDCSVDERMLRMVKLCSFGRLGALSFHRLIYPLELITIDNAVEHVKNVSIVVYKNWRKGIPETEEMARLDTTTSSLDSTMMSNTSLSDQSVMGVSGIDENSTVFQRDKLLIECAVVLWSSISKPLRKPENVALKTLCDKVMTKLFKKMFASFRQTSLLGTVMYIGSLLPSSQLEQYSISVLGLLREKTVEDEILEPYLEAGASWRLEDLMGIINDGLADLPYLLHSKGLGTAASAISSPPRKRIRKSKLTPVERIRQALHYLKYTLSSESISDTILDKYSSQLENCFESLSQVHTIIDAHLDALREADEEERKNLLSHDDIVGLLDAAAVLALFMYNTKCLRDSSSSSSSSNRASSVGPTEPANDDVILPSSSSSMTSSSPYTIHFYREIHWLEQSLLLRVTRYHSVEKGVEQLQLRLVKCVLSHMESVFSSCTQLPPPPLRENEIIIRRGSTTETETEDEGENDENRGRRLSQTSAESATSSEQLIPLRGYLERVFAVLQAIFHTSTPIDLLKKSLSIYDLLINNDGAEYEFARENGINIVGFAIGKVKRVVEMPMKGEEVNERGHGDAICTFLRTVIAKYPPDSPTEFPYQGVAMRVATISMRFLRKSIEEHGMQDPTEHSYDMNQFITVILHRIVYRIPKLYTAMRQLLIHYTVETDVTEDNDDQYMRFCTGCQLLRISAPEYREAVLKEKKNNNARRSIMIDVDAVTLLQRLDDWKKIRGMDEGTETVLREMITPM